MTANWRAEFERIMNQYLLFLALAIGAVLGQSDRCLSDTKAPST